MSGKTVLGLTAVVVAVASSGGAIALSASNAAPAPLSTLSATGTPVQLPPGDPRTQRLIDAGYDDVSLLATTGGRSFYRLELDSGRACFGTGATGTSWPFGRITCRIAEPYFPSAEMPILDLSVIGMDRGDAEPHFTRVQGLAADGVTTIRILGSGGTVLKSVPVHGNVYSELSPPAGSADLAGVDSDGTVVARIP